MWTGRPVREARCAAALLLCPFLLHLASADSKTFVMEEYCNDLIDMADRDLSALHVHLTEKDHYRKHMSCTFGVRAPPGQRLVMVTQWMDVDVETYDYCADYLSVKDGGFFNDTGYAQGVDGNLCGEKAPPPVVSTGRGLILHFSSTTYNHGKGFHLLFTAFHQGSCGLEEFSCDNGRCIDQSLKCDDYDNCGDGSDHCRVTVGDVVLAVFITSIVFLFVVGAGLLYCHRDKLRNRNKCAIIGGDPDGVYQPTTEPVAPSKNPQETTAV